MQGWGLGRVNRMERALASQCSGDTLMRLWRSSTTPHQSLPTQAHILFGFVSHFFDFPEFEAKK